MHFALFGAGPVSKSFVARLPRLSQRVGPVAAAEFRVASRIVNALGAGHAVKDFREFEHARLILICTPDAMLNAALAHLRASGIVWRQKVVLACDSGLDSSPLASLRELGAAVGSVQTIEGLGNRFVAEGDRAAVRDAKRLVRELGGSLLELDSQRMAHFAAAVSLASSLFTPLIAACTECLTAASGDPRESARLTEELLLKSVRAYGHAARKSWNGPLARGDAAAVLREWSALAETDPVLARYYRDAALFTLTWFDRYPALQEHLRNLY
jgi:predicted short-subunit dehydrogenase-like oxidoreductase (DUF2520 family)